MSVYLHVWMLEQESISCEWADCMSSHLPLHSLTLTLGNCSNSTRYNTLSAMANVSHLQLRFKLAIGQDCDCIQLSSITIDDVDLSIIR